MLPLLSHVTWVTSPHCGDIGLPETGASARFVTQVPSGPGDPHALPAALGVSVPSPLHWPHFPFLAVYTGSSGCICSCCVCRTVVAYKTSTERASPCPGAGDTQTALAETCWAQATEGRKTPETNKAVCNRALRSVDADAEESRGIRRRATWVVFAGMCASATTLVSSDGQPTDSDTLLIMGRPILQG